MLRVDLHQHLWTAPLIEALAARRHLPLVRVERDVPILHLAGERPYAIELAGEAPGRRAALLDHDGVEQAVIALSSPLGIEALEREEAEPLLAAYEAGVRDLREGFRWWGAVALNPPAAEEVDGVLERGAVGVSLPAGALASVEGVACMAPVLARLEQREAPLLVHPGPSPWSPPPREARLGDPLWWPALTGYVAELQASWLAFVAVGRRAHPRLRVVFAALAGGAPLLAERLTSRGGPSLDADPLTFYESSSHGEAALIALAGIVGAEQLLYGSDRPVAEPSVRPREGPLGRDALAERSAGLIESRVPLEAAR
ncbi:MAG TPA: hypothetical protein VHX88_11335 [Solirubrobacteraceae bacterium]|nr:hypothetical protein [Solirubrobacteraceae bacterium]